MKSLALSLLALLLCSKGFSAEPACKQNRFFCECHVTYIEEWHRSASFQMDLHKFDMQTGADTVVRNVENVSNAAFGRDDNGNDTYGKRDIIYQLALSKCKSNIADEPVCNQ